MENLSIANAFGILGAVCWSVQLIPQIIINYRRQNATGLQPTMMMLWAWAGVPLGVYNVVSNLNIALQIQPQLLTVLSLITWIQCYYYEHKWSIWKSLAVVLPIVAAMGAIEVGLVFALQTGLRRESDWPVKLMAVLAALFLALGVLRHYYDIYVHRSVRGISFLFVGIDALGDLTSIISVVFEPELDILGLAIYGVELVLWTGVFAAGWYYNLFPWLKKQIRTRRLSTASPMTHAAHGRRAQAHDIPLHDLPTSTSVFRTSSSEIEIRSRSHVTATAGSAEP